VLAKGMLPTHGDSNLSAAQQQISSSGIQKKNQTFFYVFNKNKSEIGG
jgi:hypothetical protein